MEKHCEQALYMHGQQPAQDTKVMIVPTPTTSTTSSCRRDPNALLSDTDLNVVAGGIGSGACRSSLVSCIGGC